MQSVTQPRGTGTSDADVARKIKEHAVGMDCASLSKTHAVGMYKNVFLEAAK